jgi:NTE family protein
MHDFFDLPYPIGIDPAPDVPTNGLVLTGGGARGAYQAGVLRAIARIRREAGIDSGNPFPILAGTSAGAINAAWLASLADDFDGAVSRLFDQWRGITADQVYRADAIGVARSGARWLALLTLGWAMARLWRAKPRSLLDNQPLAQFLGRHVPLERIPQLIEQGHLQGLAVTASSYTSGLHVTFFQAHGDVKPWMRTQRISQVSAITRAHLLASSAIPFAFPASQVEVDGRLEWLGDGSMRQTAPISPAIHLGARRVLVIGAGRMVEPPGLRAASADYPSLAQVAGHAMSSIFLDALGVDIERVQRINRTLSLLSPQVRADTPLRPVELLVIAPSERLDDIAARHLRSLPLPVRTLLKAIGVTKSDPRGAALASYLLFEAPYTSELIALGEKDTLARREDVLRFFGWPDASAMRTNSSPAVERSLSWMR